MHGDTPAQSAPVFGLAYLLGINLMPRIRNLKQLVFYKPDKRKCYEHINALFSKTINWQLIETHVPDMLRVALSIKAGKIAPSTLTLKDLKERGHHIDHDILRGLAPYRTDHINRFGDYTLDFDRQVSPMNYNAKIC